MKNLRQTFKSVGWGVMSAVFVLQPTLAQAEIQRSFLNPSFEQPVFPFSSTGQPCYIQVDQATIPGWTTTHTPKLGTTNCISTGYTLFGNIIEIWKTGFNSVNTATDAGNQFAELNAEENAALFQKLCLVQGESIKFSLLHRGRGSATVPDVADFSVAGNSIVKVSTTNNGTVGTPVVGANTTLNTPASAGNNWVRYGGTFIYNGATADQDVRFTALSTGTKFPNGTSNLTIGNFLDEVQFAGDPVIEFQIDSSSDLELQNPLLNPPKIKIVGLVPPGGINVDVAITGGTAIVGTDFTTSTGTANFTITIPEGNYDGINNSTFPILFTVANDAVFEGNETIEFQVQPSSPSSPNKYIIGSTTTCGGTPNLKSTYTITDDDFVSGTVWNDANGSANNTFTNIKTGSETGTNAGVLNAILVDANDNDRVIATTPVNADGTYSFTDVAKNKTSLKVILSTTPGTVGVTAPQPSLPANWINTSPLTTLPFATSTTNITGKDFGIEQLPNTNDSTATSQPNPGGTNRVVVPNLSGTDPEDGTLGTGKTFKIVTLPNNGTLYYNNAAVTANQVITNYDPALLTVDPNDGAITVTFTVAAVDAANREDPSPATVTIPFTPTVATNPQLLLVKRITAINSTPFTNIVDDASSDNDNNPGWPNNFLQGRTDGGAVKPGDELEYTIYFLSSGNTSVTNVNICDLVPDNTSFVTTSFSANSGISLRIGSTTNFLTNISDAPDRGEYLAPGTTPPTSFQCVGNNTNGAVLVNIVTKGTSEDILPNATAPGTPENSSGFIRFRAKVK
ncbi:hypothetical protein NIES4074_02920 [Cylindrospermum sp. NIES-4074]|nr:hypothetical protein NIES4074_02920 [Cylindrospermum sp. NIES-4074]